MALMRSGDSSRSGDSGSRGGDCGNPGCNCGKIRRDDGKTSCDCRYFGSDCGNSGGSRGNPGCSSVNRRWNCEGPGWDRRDGLHWGNDGGSGGGAGINRLHGPDSGRGGRGSWLHEDGRVGGWLRGRAGGWGDRGGHAVGWRRQSFDRQQLQPAGVQAAGAVAALCTSHSPVLLAGLSAGHVRPLQILCMLPVLAPAQSPSRWREGDGWRQVEAFKVLQVHSGYGPEGWSGEDITAGRHTYPLPDAGVVRDRHCLAHARVSLCVLTGFTCAPMLCFC